MTTLDIAFAQTDLRAVVTRAIVIVLVAATIMLFVKMASLFDPGPFENCHPEMSRLFMAQTATPMTLPVCFHVEVGFRSEANPR